MLVRQRAEQAATAGKKFSTFAARERYAEDEVRRFLKGHGRAIALHELEDWILREPHRLIYVARS